MAITQTEIAQGVGSVASNPSLQEIISPVSRQLVTYIIQEVRATEKPSRIIQGGSPLDTALRRRILAERLTMAALHAEAFGAKEEARKAAAQKIVIPAKP